MIVALSWGLSTPSAAGAQTTPEALGQMSIEELMDIEVTSASRRDQRAWDVAAAIHVITRDDIRRSGMTTIPDLLRMVPGVQVAQINANKWAVTVRGFNSLYANKLLVLVDGRSVYNRLFSGVLWGSQDLLFDDIDRIEVIRGPAAALWGANAVNGVVNIISRSAADTQGGLVRTDLGTDQQGAIRYGGMAGAVPYRVHAQWTNRHESRLAGGAGADDGSSNLSAGFRTDWGDLPNAMLLEGGLTTGQSRGLFTNFNSRTAGAEPVSRDRSDAVSGHLLARWTRTPDDGPSLQVQSFVDLGHRDEPLGNYDRRAFDLDTHYRMNVGARHDLVAGAGYRLVSEQFDGGVGFTLIPAHERSTLLTAFAQDEIAISQRVHVTFGSQVQYHSVTGAGVQPSARVMWTPGPRQRMWAAVSRALRTPSLAQRGVQVDYAPVPTPSGLPLVVTVLGNQDSKDETFVDGELGYRLELGIAAAIDVTAFAGSYDDLQTNDAADPVVEFVPSPQLRVVSTFGNQLEATTRGLEAAGFWTPLPGWHLNGSVTAFRLDASRDAGTGDALAASEARVAPRWQWQLRSNYAPMARVSLNIALFHVGPLEELRIAGYTRTDVTGEWQVARRLTLMAIGQNLFGESHTEFDGVTSLVLATQVPRSGGLRLRWTLR